jgi:hypothetical protein
MVVRPEYSTPDSDPPAKPQDFASAPLFVQVFGDNVAKNLNKVCYNRAG